MAKKARDDDKEKKKAILTEHKKLIRQKKTTYFIDVETNIGRKAINADHDAEAVSIGIASLDDKN